MEQNNIIFKTMLITPSLAKEILESNLHNRKLRQDLVNQYANEMVSDRWKVNTGETIKISKSNRLIDGQHRLYAVIKANKAILMCFSINLEDDVFDVIDTGLKRNANDVFQTQSVRNYNTIPSIIKAYNNFINQRNHRTQGKTSTMTNAMILEKYHEDAEFWQYVAKCSHSWYVNFAKIITPSMIGGLFSMLYKLNEQRAISFFDQLCNGIDVENNAIHLLRNKLMQDKMSPKKISQPHKIALIIKTWNYFVKNEKIKVLKFDTVRDEFPKPIKP